MAKSFPHTPEWFNGSRLWCARGRRRLSPHELAAAVGVTPGVIRGLEDGSTCTSMAVIEKIASVLEWPIGFFFLDDIEVPHIHFWH